jgi:sigma-B regulation protein RsbU (phosphoserine phosphatase)
MVMVSIDREHETISYVNAGHNPAYLIVDGKIDTMKSHGLPIGILSGTRYATQTRAFPAGSCVVLYSDGITEAEDVSDEEFGNERLEALLEQHLDYSASLIRDQIADAVDSFVGEAPQKDDETLVIVRRA